jgi:hypothetical protein
MKKIVAALLCLCLCLPGCGKQPDPTEASTAAPSAEVTTEVTTEATTEPTTVPTTEPEEMQYRHPLTGELLTEPFTVRPIAVSTNNYRAAQPVLGIRYADIVFEHITEGLGTETRMLAIYTNLNFDERVGTVRSARTYSVSLSAAFDAIFVHCGGSRFANKKISQMNYPSYDQFYNADYFYRDPSRISAGYASEHTLVTEGKLLQQGLETKDWDLTAPEDISYGFTFSDEADLGGAAAQTVTIQYYNKDGKYTIMSYNKNDGMYYGVQSWYKKQGAVADGNTGDQVPYKNVLVLKTKVTHDSDGSHVYMDLTGEGNGFLARDGQYVAIKWFRATENDPFTFTLEDGSPVTFGVGKTFVSVLPIRSPEVIFE